MYANQIETRVSSPINADGSGVILCNSGVVAAMIGLSVIKAESHDELLVDAKVMTADRTMVSHSGSLPDPHPVSAVNDDHRAADYFANQGWLALGSVTGIGGPPSRLRGADIILLKEKCGIFYGPSDTTAQFEARAARGELAISARSLCDIARVAPQFHKACSQFAATFEMQA